MVVQVDSPGSKKETNSTNSTQARFLLEAGNNGTTQNSPGCPFLSEGGESLELFLTPKI